MDFYTGTVRDCCARLLASATSPMTVAAIAAQVGAAPTHVGRALRQLESRGLAVRHQGCGARPGGGRTPQVWTAAQ